jgi:type VI protein secretion system component Hcp
MNRPTDHFVPYKMRNPIISQCKNDSNRESNNERIEKIHLDFESFMVIMTSSLTNLIAEKGVAQNQ